jgi:hypothetical protein
MEDLPQEKEQVQEASQGHCPAKETPAGPQGHKRSPPYRNRHSLREIRISAKEAVSYLKLSNGGPYSSREVQWIIADIMEVPQSDGRVGCFNFQQCETLIWRLLVRGLA